MHFTVQHLRGGGFDWKIRANNQDSPVRQRRSGTFGESANDVITERCSLAMGSSSVDRIAGERECSTSGRSRGLHMELSAVWYVALKAGARMAASKYSRL